MKGVILLALIATLLATGVAAAATTPAAYRTKVNSICRTYTPKVKTLEAQIKKAQAAKNYTAYGYWLGQLLVLGITQDKQIEAVPVPAALKTTMAPIISRMKKIDVYAKAALGDAANGYITAMQADLRQISTLATPLDKLLDTAGLRDCGSNQA